MTHAELLDKVYETAVYLTVTDRNDFDNVDDEDKRYIEYIISRSESNKGMVTVLTTLVTVLTTLLTHKIIAPEQDIRYHQAGLDNGFAGRGIDQSHVTPFMKKVSFPAMAESGWLTRSLEQAHPYTLEYPGKITPKEAKTAFLTIIDKVQAQGANPHAILLYKRLVANAYEKFKIFNTDRYYLLTTASMDNADWDGINEEINRIAQIHGCQVIVNGVYDTLRYYMRLLSNTAEFIKRYVDLLKADEAIKFQHKTMWNDIVSGR